AGVNKPPDQPGISVWSRDLSNTGVHSVESALETTEAGLRLYQRLKTAPPFRFARAAWEAGNVPARDLPDYMTTYGEGKRRLDVDCVLDEALYRSLGSPEFCYPFRDGYWWTRYRGETYRPLYSSDQGPLNGLCRELFPEYFAY